MLPPAKFPVLKNPSLHELLKLLQKQTHVRAVASANDLFAWRPAIGDHDLVMGWLGLKPRDVLPIRIYDDVIEPNFHMSGSKWEHSTEYEVRSFLEKHEAVSMLLSVFQIL